MKRDFPSSKVPLCVLRRFDCSRSVLASQWVSHRGTCFPPLQMSSTVVFRSLMRGGFIALLAFFMVGHASASSSSSMAPYCGDGQCNGSDSCMNCSADCGFCSSSSIAPYCGDGLCNGSDSCLNCSADCGFCSSSSSSVATYCGDGTCNGSEECDGYSYCSPYDMGCSYYAAPYGMLNCNPNCTVDASQCLMSICGDNMCEYPEDSGSCPSDCGMPSYCGDTVCDMGEDCNTCSGDCGACSSSSASPYCGDGICNGSETCSDCSAECGLCSSSSAGPICGNNTCEFPEQCDGADFCGANCQSFGFTNGSLVCSSCGVSTAGCYNDSSSSSASVSSSASSEGSSSSVPAPFFSWWSLPLLLLACAGAWWFQRDSESSGS